MGCIASSALFVSTCLVCHPLGLKCILLMTAFMSRPLQGGKPDKASHLLEPKVFVMVYKIILRLKLEVSRPSND
jgi:hypothetical protein